MFLGMRMMFGCVITGIGAAWPNETQDHQAIGPRGSLYLNTHAHHVSFGKTR